MIFRELGKNKKIINSIIGIWTHLTEIRRKQLFSLFLLMILSGFSEMLSIAAVIPFLGVLTDPSKLLKVQLIRNLSNISGINTPEELILPITLLFSFSAIFTTSIRLISLWKLNKLAGAIGNDISTAAFRKIISQNYEAYLQSNSGDLINSLTTQLTKTVSAINLILQLSSSIIICFGLVISLFYFDWKTSVLSITIFFLIYLLLANFIRGTLVKNSISVAKSSSKQVQSLQEGLGFVRDMILDNSYDIHIQRYKKNDFSLRMGVAESRFLAAFPRFILETIGLIFVALLGYYFTNQNQGDTFVIQKLGVFALAASRILPSMQQIYASWAGIYTFSADIQSVLNILELKLVEKIDFNENKNFRLKNKIILKDISYRYPNQNKNILSQINLTINKGERIGIIGASGCGKSTLMDIVMGLMKPTKGSILIDEKNMHKKNKFDLIVNWRRRIAHVPQNIYLSDSTIYENIAFGQRIDLIDKKRVIKAAKQAHLDEFINDLPLGYKTFVGERGIRLSGGQRQRIGIARALYKECDLLVFDEATSSLDNNFERLVIESIKKLNNNYTIIIIAHRLSTISYCDRVIKIENESISEIIDYPKV